MSQKPYIAGVLKWKIFYSQSNWGDFIKIGSKRCSLGNLKSDSILYAYMKFALPQRCQTAPPS